MKQMINYKKVENIEQIIDKLGLIKKYENIEDFENKI